MALGRVFVEHDLHRNALHHFDVVAGGVFGGEQAEARTAGASDGIDMPLVGLAVGIHRDVSRQTGFHLPELRLLEVRRAQRSPSPSGMTFIISWPGCTF